MPNMPPDMKILCNGAQCASCHTVIWSQQPNDLKWCKCGSIFVDGGLEYLRRGYRISRSDFIDLSKVEAVPVARR